MSKELDTGMILFASFVIGWIISTHTTPKIKWSNGILKNAFYLFVAFLEGVAFFAALWVLGWIRINAFGGAG